MKVQGEREGRDFEKKKERKNKSRNGSGKQLAVHRTLDIIHRNWLPLVSSSSSLFYHRPSLRVFSLRSNYAGVLHN